MEKRIKEKNGFGILEVLIASMILIVVVGAAVALGHASLRSSALAADKNTAYNLAQEGIELVRNIRDSAWVDGVSSTDWSSGLSIGSSYILEQRGGKWKLTISSYEEITKGEPPIKYRRKVKIDRVGWYTAGNIGIPNIPAEPNNVIRKVTVEVKWDSQTGERTITAETYLTDWKTY